MVVNERQKVAFAPLKTSVRFLWRSWSVTHLRLNMWYLTITCCLDVMSGQQEVYLLHMQELRNSFICSNQRNVGATAADATAAFHLHTMSSCVWWCHQGQSLLATSTSCIILKPNLSSCSRHLHFLPCVFSVLVSTPLPLLSSCTTDPDPDSDPALERPILPHNLFSTFASPLVLSSMQNIQFIYFHWIFPSLTFMMCFLYLISYSLSQLLLKNIHCCPNSIPAKKKHFHIYTL